jgi:hypothetical protein
MVKNEDFKNFARTLIYIPIIHTQADMGALRDQVRQASLQKIGRTALRRKTNTIDQIWTNIEMAMDQLNLSYESVRLYQDGLPVCGREAEIVKDLAAGGSRNHTLLHRLMEKGATIMGTESAELLVEEYEIYKETLAYGDPSQPARMEVRQKGLPRSLLERRDQYIGHRINNTLCRGETGILFVGMLHSLENLLNEDIRVVYPLGKPCQNKIGKG